MSTHRRHPLTRHAARRIQALEARLMFDGAAVAEALSQQHADAWRDPAAGAPTTPTGETARDTLRDSAPHRSLVASREPIAADARAASEPAPGRELLFIDREVADLDFLLGGVREGIEVVLLDGQADPWAQMGAALAARPGTTAVHLVSHGNTGELILGGQAYGSSELLARADSFAAWQSGLAPGADILLYGCDVAAGGQGRALVDTLGRLTGADIAASNDATGGTAAQGDWQLEYATGLVEAQHFLSDATASAYGNRLATVALNGVGGWVPIMFGPTRDPQGDSQAGAADTDIIGDATHGSLYTAFSDSGTAGTGDDYLYFRMRIDNPTSTSNFSGVAVVGMDVNNDGRVDLFMSVDGRNNGQAVRLLDPGTGLNNSANTTSTAPLPTGWLPNNGVYAFTSSNYAVTAVSSATDPNWGPSSTGMAGGTPDNLTGLGGTDVFVSWRVPIVDLATVLAKASPVDRNGIYGPRGATGLSGFTKDTPVSYVSFTQTQNGPINGDLNGVGSSYDKNATFSSLGVMTAPMTPANPVAAATQLGISDNVAGVANGPVTFTFQFSEGVSGFSASDITVTGGTPGTFTAIDGDTYTLVVTPTPGTASGEIAVSVAAGAAIGTSGTPTVAASATQAYDTLAPLVTVDTPTLALNGQPTLSGTTDLPDGSLIKIVIDPDNDASTLNNVVYQALVSAGAWTLNTATATPVSGSLPSSGLSPNSKVTATATDAAGNTGTAVELNRPTVQPLSTNDTTPVLQGNWTRISGDTLSIEVRDATNTLLGTYTLAPTSDTWSVDLGSVARDEGGLLSLTAGQTYTVTATVTRGAATASDTTSSELVITTEAVKAIDITGGASASGSSTRPTITGTSSNAGGFVIVRLDPNNDGDLSDAVTYSVSTADGSWSLDTATATPISGTVPQGGFVGAVGVRATDSTGAVADTQVLNITTPSIAIGSITSTQATNAFGQLDNSAGTGSTWLNVTEDNSVTISGTASGGTAVDLQITDANGHVITVSSVAVTAGSWTATGIDLSALDDGVLTIKATVAGTSTSATNTSVTHDKTAPIIDITAQDPLKKTAALVTGDTNLAQGTLLTVSIIDNATSTVKATWTGIAVAADGSFTTNGIAPTSGSSNIGNNPSFTITVTPTGTATDAAGNIAQAVSETRLAQPNSSANTITIATIAGDDIITAGEIGVPITLSGTTSLTGTPVINLVVSDFSGNSVTLAPFTALNGTWSTTLSPTQVKTLANGPLTVTATTQETVSGVAYTISDVRFPTLTLPSPTLVITDNVAGTATGDVIFTFTFSEAVTGFTASDINLSAGTAGSFSGSGTTYTLVVTPPPGSSGSLTASVADEAAIGSNTGRTSVGSSDTQAYETTGAAAAPTITINADALATDATPLITGTTNLAAGAPIVITIDPNNDGAFNDAVTYSATVQAATDGLGNRLWSVDLSSATPTSGSLPAGGLVTYAMISATATNAYGNSSTAVALDAPAVAAQITNDSTPTLSGTWTSLVGDSLSVSVSPVGGGPATVYAVGSGLSVSGNTWTLTSVNLADGSYDVTATTTRGATGKTDVTSSELVVDTAATVDITGGASVLSNDATPVVAGTSSGLPTGTLLTLKLDTDNNGSFDLTYQTAVKADGSWSVDTATAVPVSGQMPAAGLNGSTPMSATATDAAGNTGSDAQTLVVDVTPPAIAFNSGVRAASSLPLISGTTDLPPGSTLTLLIDPNNDGDWSDAQSYSGIVVQSDGSWSVQTTLALSGTVKLRATGTDAAGNSVVVEQPLSIDPNTPTIAVDTVATPNNDQIADASEDDAITLSGSTTQLADGTLVTVTLTDGNITITDKATVTGGSWSLDPLNLSTLASGTLTVTATAVDSGGVAYTATTSFGHDKSAVVAIDAISQDTGRLADFITTDTTVALYGTATPGATVTVVVKDAANLVVASFNVTADAGSGAWSTADTPLLALGAYTVQATVGGSTATKALTIVAAPTLVSSNPADNSTGVAVAADIDLVFNKSVQAGTGQVVLYTAAGVAVESFNVATGVGSQGGSLSFNGSTGLKLNPFASLATASGYYLKIDATAIVDTDGNGYAGIASPTTLNFSTAGANAAPVNSVPAAQSVNEDSSLAFSGAQLISVSDADGNLATVKLTVLNGKLSVNLADGAVISAGANASQTLTLSGNQTQINAALASLAYQGGANFNGSDSLTVLSSDSAGTPLTDSDTVSITVQAVNDAPVTAPVNLGTIAQDSGAILITQAQLLAQASDPENDALSVSGLTITAGQGSLLDNGNGTWTYTPAPGNSTPVSFAYTITDNGTSQSLADPKSVTGSATLEITPVDLAAVISGPSGGPGATGSAATVAENTTAVHLFTANESVSWSLAGGADETRFVIDANGQLSFKVAPDYEAPADLGDGAANNTYVVVVRATDAAGQATLQTVTVTVTDVDESKPADDRVLGQEDQPLAGNVLANDGPAASPVAHFAVAGGSAVPAGQTLVLDGVGSLRIDADGQFTFTPHANWNGAVPAITYTNQAGEQAVLQLELAAVNDAPVLPTAALSLFQDSPLNGQLPPAIDAEGQPVQYTLAQAPAHGTLSLDADGHYRYTPAAGFSGSDRFEVEVSDGQGGTTRTWFEVTVLPLPSIVLPAAYDTGVSDSDLRTGADSIVLAGTGLPGQQLALYSPAGALLGKTTVGSDGRWSVADIKLAALTGDQAGAAPGAEGRYTFTVRAVADDGQLSPAVSLSLVRELPAPPPVPAPEPLALPQPEAEAPPAAPAEAPVAAILAPEPPPAFAAVLGGSTGGIELPPLASPVPELLGPSPAGIYVRDGNVGDLYTRPSGFQIMVNPMPEPSLRLFRGIDDQTVKLGSTVNLQVPADTFIHTNPNETVVLQAQLADGRPLPGWLRFDGRSGTLVGEVPEDWRQDLVIRVVARDSQGREATAMMRLKASDVQRGRVSGLSLQLMKPHAETAAQRTLTRSASRPA